MQGRELNWIMFPSKHSRNFGGSWALTLTFLPAEISPIAISFHANRLLIVASNRDVGFLLVDSQAPKMLTGKMEGLAPTALDALHACVGDFTDASLEENYIVWTGTTGIALSSHSGEILFSSLYETKARTSETLYPKISTFGNSFLMWKNDALEFFKMYLWKESFLLDPKVKNDFPSAYWEELELCRKEDLWLDKEKEELHSFNHLPSVLIQHIRNLDPDSFVSPCCRAWAQAIQPIWIGCSVIPYQVTITSQTSQKCSSPSVNFALEENGGLKAYDKKTNLSLDSYNLSFSGRVMSFVGAILSAFEISEQKSLLAILHPSALLILVLWEFPHFYLKKMTLLDINFKSNETLHILATNLSYLYLETSARLCICDLSGRICRTQKRRSSLSNRAIFLDCSTLLVCDNHGQQKLLTLFNFQITRVTIDVEKSRRVTFETCTLCEENRPSEMMHSCNGCFQRNCFACLSGMDFCKPCGRLLRTDLSEIH
jgi:hypothetical protein